MLVLYIAATVFFFFSRGAMETEGMGTLPNKALVLSPTTSKFGMYNAIFLLWIGG